MILITGLTLKYYCFSCHYVATMELIHEGINSLKRFTSVRICPVCCKETFRMVNAIIYRSNTLYGKPNGTWRCAWHSDVYYPAIFERAFKIINEPDGTEIDSRVFPTVSSHIAIARLGVPLKCPKCGCLLKYYEPPTSMVSTSAAQATIDKWNRVL